MHKQPFQTCTAPRARSHFLKPLAISQHEFIIIPCGLFDTESGALTEPILSFDTRSGAWTSISSLDAQQQLLVKCTDCNAIYDKKSHTIFACGTLPDNESQGRLVRVNLKKESFTSMNVPTVEYPAMVMAGGALHILSNDSHPRQSWSHYVLNDDNTQLKRIHEYDDNFDCLFAVHIEKKGLILAFGEDSAKANERLVARIYSLQQQRWSTLALCDSIKSRTWFLQCPTHVITHDQRYIILFDEVSRPEQNAIFVLDLSDSTMRTCSIECPAHNHAVIMRDAHRDRLLTQCFASSKMPRPINNFIAELICFEYVHLFRLRRSEDDDEHWRINVDDILQAVTKTERNKRCYECSVENSKSVELRLCGRCQSVRYCSRYCQKISWNFKHRDYCKSLY